MGIHRQLVSMLKTHYPNVAATLLPLWCRSGTSDHDLVYPHGTSDYILVYEESKLWSVRRKMAKWYSKLWFTDDYSTSGGKISDAIKSPPVSS